MMFVTMATLRENGQTYRYETSSIDTQWLWDYAIKFARWQHPAMRRGATLGDFAFQRVLLGKSSVYTTENPSDMHELCANGEFFHESMLPDNNDKGLHERDCIFCDTDAR